MDNIKEFMLPILTALITASIIGIASLLSGVIHDVERLDKQMHIIIDPTGQIRSTPEIEVIKDRIARDDCPKPD